MRILSVPCLFTVLILFGLIHTGTSYKCYFCAGVSSQSANPEVTPDVPITHSCVDLQNTKNLTTTHCPRSCVKAVVITTKGYTLVMRGCTEPPQCLDRNGKCYHCEGDLCNSAVGVGSSLFVIVSAISLIFNKIIL